MKVLPCPGQLPVGLLFLYKISPNQKEIHIHPTPHTHTHTYTHRVTISVTIEKINKTLVQI